MAKVKLIDRVGKLADPALQEDLAAFLELRRELMARGALVPDDPFDALAGMTSTRIAAGLQRVLGRRKALWTRTKISQIAEREDGIRQGRRGRDCVA